MQKCGFEIGGMSCAACAARVERAVSALPGVSAVNVLLLKNRLTLVLDESRCTPSLVEEAVRKAGYSARAEGERPHQVEQVKATSGLYSLGLTLGLFVAVMALGMIPALGEALGLGFMGLGTLQLILTLGVMFLQRGIFYDAFKAAAHGGTNMNTLVALGALSSLCYSLWQLCSGMGPGETDSNSMSAMGSPADSGGGLYFESAAGILSFIAIGRYLEGRARRGTTAAVQLLYELSPKLVCVERPAAAGTEQVQVPAAAADADMRSAPDTVQLQLEAEALQVGDIVVLRAGDRVPADGVICEGQGHLDESALTGENLPKSVQVGAELLSGALVTDGFLKMRAQRVGSAATLGRIIALVDEAASQKAPLARLADLLAARFVPLVLALSALTFICWYVLLHSSFAQALNYAVCVLVISCPCALGLATPVALMAGLGRAARLGVLFKEAAAAEYLGRARVLALDKTGTLTYGKLHLESIIPAVAGQEAAALLLAASLEVKSSHPLAQAIVAAAQERGLGSESLLPCTDFALLPGVGVRGQVAGTTLYVGNGRLMEGLSLSLKQQEVIESCERSGKVALCLLRESEAGRELMALMCLGDELRAEAAQAVDFLTQLGVECVILSGDSEKAVGQVAATLGIEQAYARLLPEDKAAKIKQLKAEGRVVAMAGDGVNDSLSLCTADVGIGVAGSSDIALESCQVALLKPDLKALARAFYLGRRIVRTILENLGWAFLYNIICIPLAAGATSAWGLALTPMYAALMMSLSSLCVVLNALRLNYLKVPLPDSTYEKEGAEAVISPSTATEHTKEQKMHTTLKIDGMHCEHCVAAVTKALESLPGVSAVQVSLERGEAQLDAAAGLNEALFKSAVEGAGFELTQCKSA